MKKVVIYPGRFQPMLGHHASVYQKLVNEHPDAEVYITTSDKVEADRSPFNFKEKQSINKILENNDYYNVFSFTVNNDTQYRQRICKIC